MFVITDEIRVTRKVVIRVPKDGLSFGEETIKVTFLLLDLDAEQDLQDAAFTVPLREDFDDDGGFQRALRDQRAKAAAYSRDLIRRVLVDWPSEANIGREDGSPIPFSEEARDNLARIPFVHLALVDAYRDAVAKKRRGN